MMSGANAPEVVNYHQPGLESVDGTNDKVLEDTHTTSNYMSPPKRSRSIFGLSPLALGSLVAVITGVSVGAAVGGGVGASLANCNSDKASKNSPSTTITTTVYETVTSSASSTATLVQNYSPPRVSSTDTLAHNCTNGDTIQSYWSQSFSMLCSVDYTSGLEGTDGNPVGDLDSIIAYTIDDCLNACSGRNYDYQTWGTGQMCMAVSWQWDLRNITENQGANCWLKNSTLSEGSIPNSNIYAITATLN